MPKKTLRILFGFCEADLDLAEQIAQHLKEQGFPAIVLVNQEQKHLRVQESVRQCDVLLLLFSTHTTHDDVLSRLVAIGQRQRKYIIPLLLGINIAPFGLTILQHIDLTADYHTGIRDISQALQAYANTPKRLQARWRAVRTQHPFLVNFLLSFMITVLISSSSLFLYSHFSASTAQSLHFPHYPHGHIQEYTLPRDASTACAITAGKDGYLWFIEPNDNRIGRISAVDGAITEFPAFTSNGTCQPHMALDAQGNLWYVESPGQIGRINPDGSTTDFPEPSSQYLHPEGGYLEVLAMGTDGNVWFTISQGGGGNDNQNRVGFMTPDGIYTAVLIPTQNSYPFDIIRGRNRDLWFAEPDTNIIGHIPNLHQLTQSGAITEYPLGPLLGDYAGVNYLAIGADHNIWFSDYGGRIGAIRPDGKLIAKYASPTSYSRPEDIVSGPDGNLWVIGYNDETSQTAIIKMTITGKMTIIPVSKSFAITSLVTGPDGNIWFTGGNTIGFVTP